MQMKQMQKICSQNYRTVSRALETCPIRDLVIMVLRTANFRLSLARRARLAIAAHLVVEYAATMQFQEEWSAYGILLGRECVHNFCPSGSDCSSNGYYAYCCK
ncbi:hypothetical protein TELCIR_18616 [Teladorsagia circumcincta]|uniref:Uncharacterized protein n=1 Tax=Teladorsagia circumcincta TaxID=45464 RepID=A0A2G9TPN9_TELCI|nr:hypothetical protein TELCIR_18616 [Teladorsagia circumcincta]